MKRYERMNKEEIIGAFKTMTKCETCRFQGDRCNNAGGCCGQMVDYLNKEIKMLSRWQTIKSDEDLEKLGAEYSKMCDNRKCDKCEYHNKEHICFLSYLLEKIEVEEAE